MMISITGNNNRFSSKAFTLIEALVVLVIMGMVLGISVPLFRFFTTGNKLQSAARNVCTALRTARSLAIVKRAVYGVDFDTLNSEYTIHYDADGDKATGDTDDIIVEKVFRLPEGIVFSAPSSNNVIWFKKDGSMDTSYSDIILQDTVSADTKTINVYPSTGAVKVAD